jgi:predicted nucleotide-binding protein
VAHPALAKSKPLRIWPAPKIFSHFKGWRTRLESKEVVALNENVLIEIGAAMALYGERFILLVKDGVKLPSNLQGMYEVRYAAEKLDGNETIKLMSSINDMKTKRLASAV